MARYRTTTRIVADMLEAAQDCGREGIRSTSLTMKANLPYMRLSKFLDNLTGNGLINKIEYDGKHAFVITQKGRQYLETYKRFADFSESFGVDL